MTAQFDLSGSVAVVTAGCSGLGFVIAETLAAMGAVTVATTRDAQTARRFGEADGRAGSFKAMVFDLQSQSIRPFVEEVTKRFGSLDILVNCAASRPKGTAVEEIGPEDFQREFEDSVIRPFECAQAVVAYREHTHIRSIVNIGSIYGSLAVDHRIYEDPNQQTPIAYSCAKAALAQMTRYLAACWAPLSIRVNCVSPGGVKRAQTSEFYRRYSERVPMARMANPDEVAGAVAFLASDASTYITGENLMVDGGLHVW